MKLKVALATALLCVVPVANGAVSITAFNFTGPTDGLAVLDENNEAVAASIQFGGFLSGLPDFGGSVVDIYNAFTSNGGALATVQPGFFNGVIGDAATSTDGTDPFTITDPNASIYALIGVGGDVIVVGGDELWPAEVEGVGATVSFDLSSASILRGNVVAREGGGLFPGVTQGITAVPEPSIALLGAFGILGLIRRRR